MTAQEVFVLARSGFTEHKEARIFELQSGQFFEHLLNENVLFAVVALDFKLRRLVNIPAIRKSRKLTAKPSTVLLRA